MKELKKSTRREPVSRKKNTAEKKEQTAKKSTKKNTGKEIKKENKKDTEKGTWKSVTKERVYDPNGKVLVITYACVVLFLALAVYMGYFLQMKSEDVINNPYNARLDSFSDRIVRGSIWHQMERCWQRLPLMMREMKQGFTIMEVCLTMR